MAKKQKPREPETGETYGDDPRGQAARWAVEFDAARKALETWKQEAKEAVDQYLGDVEGFDEDLEANIWYSDVETLRCNLYGQRPSVDVDRTHADADDDLARVGSEELSRILNTDLKRGSDATERAYKNALFDYATAGLGVVWLRLERKREMVPEIPARVDPLTGMELAPAVPATERIVSERVETDYIYFEDFLYSPCRVWDEMRWAAKKVSMPPAALEKRFGAELAARIPRKTKTANESKDGQNSDPNPRAEVWEVWDLDRRQVCWYVEGFGEVLECVEDPLKLEGFWPLPEFLVANRTTRKLVPRTNYRMARSLYVGLNRLAERIALLEDALIVRGVYDSTATALKDLLKRGKSNKMIPVDKWAMFAEKGGLKGVTDWFPIDMVAATLERVEAQFSRKSELLRQVTGQADIMRGVTDPRETKGAQQIKARFGSTRLKDKQDEFARFISDAQRKKAEIVAKHFSVESIVAQSNMERTADAPIAHQAAEALKLQVGDYRVQVKSSSLAAEDTALMTQSAVEYLGALGKFFSDATPMLQVSGPVALPYVFKMAQAALATMPGADRLEPVFDALVGETEKQAAMAAQQQAMQASQPPPPDPKIVAAEMKAQGDQQKVQADMMGRQFDLQADLTRIGAETKAEVVKQASQAMFAERQSAADAARNPTGGIV